jgi:hypothetical protein
VTQGESPVTVWIDRKMTEPGPIIVPSAELVAVVRHSAVPTTAPDDLIPYVRPTVDAAGNVTDWLLTEDTLAFADVSVPMRFAEWRTAWERSWMLDPISVLERLVAVAHEFQVSAPSTTLLERVLDPGTTGPGGDLVHAMLDADEAARLTAVTDSLRDAIADRARKGWGFVDATPGRQRVGLVRAWSPQLGPETLAADRYVSARMDAEDGLTVTVFGADGDVVDRAVSVHEVEIAGDRVEIRSASGSTSTDLLGGRVLSWLMPGCTMWRVRQVPEVLVWAKSFAGFQESADYAAALGRPVLLTSLRLSDSDSDPRPSTPPPPRRLESRIDQEQ